MVGAKRVIDVMDVSTQEALQMTMGGWFPTNSPFPAPVPPHQPALLVRPSEWTRYYMDPDKDTLLNVLSLEFSHSRLDAEVRAPRVVRQIDWVSRVWPRELIAQQRTETNDMQQMKYPKVRKYCLMSVGGCYTDFHIDFGGSSVWYHVFRGMKVGGGDGSGGGGGGRFGPVSPPTRLQPSDLLPGAADGREPEQV